jgi:hypothetical protein
MPETPPLVNAILDQENAFVGISLAIIHKLSPLRKRIFWSDTRAEPAVRTEVAGLMRYMFLVAWSRIPASDQARRDAVGRLSSAMYGDSTPQDITAGIDYYTEQGPAWAFLHNLYRTFEVYPTPEKDVVWMRLLSERLKPLLELLQREWNGVRS